MIEIPLKNRAGQVVAITIIDDEDAELARYPWYLQKKGYVTTSRPGCNRNQKLLLHRLILNAPLGVKVDHRNRNPLDNRRSNLRLTSDAGNAQNRGMDRRNKSGFKGVRPCGDKWRAIIHAGRKWMHLGMFRDIRDAARAYDQAAANLFGEFAAGNNAL